MGRLDWLERFVVFADRDAARTELDAQIAEWTRAQDAASLMRELQAIGVTAGAVYHGLDLLEDPHLGERGFQITQHHRYAGTKRYPLQPYRFRHWANPRSDRPSPTLGQHTREVLARLTSLTTAEVDQLEADDVIGEIPLAARTD